MDETAGFMRASPLALRLKLISRVALATSLVAMAALITALLIVGNDSSAVYVEAIRAHSLTERMLAPALVLTGLVLLILVGLITWLASLHVSFHVAGPLFRFSRNFAALTCGEETHGIRRDDQLQELSMQMHSSINVLHSHYHDVQLLAKQAEGQLMQADATGSLAQTLQQLKQEADRVRLR